MAVIDVKVVRNYWGWTPRGVWIWFRFGWAKPISIWGVEHGITTERARALINRVRGDENAEVPDQSAHRIYRRRLKIGPFCFSAGMYQGERDAA